MVDSDDRLRALEREVEDLRVELARERTLRVQTEDASEIFRVMFEHASDALFLFDDSGIIDCNSQALTMMRAADKQDFLKRHPAEFSPERQPDGRESMEKSREMDGTARAQGYHSFEWMHRRLDGEHFPVQVTLTPVELARGPAMLVVWHELSAFKARERRLAAQLEMIGAQQAEIQRLAMPVIPVGDGVVMVPVLGDLPEDALEELSATILDAVARAGTKSLILDLTGLARASMRVVSWLGRLIAATSLVGVNTLVAGIQPAIALELVHEGLDLGGATIVASMREALRQSIARG